MNFWTRIVCLMDGVRVALLFKSGFFLEISAKNGNIFVKKENDGFKSWKFYFWCQVEWMAKLLLSRFLNLCIFGWWWWQRAYLRYWRILHFLNLKIFIINRVLLAKSSLLIDSYDLGIYQFWHFLQFFVLFWKWPFW